MKSLALTKRRGDKETPTCVIRDKDRGVLYRFVMNVQKERQLYLMLLPMLAYFFVFQYLPLYGLQIAFKNFSPFKGIIGSPFVGFDNFILFFSSPYFQRNLVNTLLISVYGLIFSFPAPIILALLLNELKQKQFKATVQTISYMPHFVSAVVVAGIVTNFLSPTSGLVNILLEKVGVERINFLTRPEYFRTIYISMGLWKETGFSSIIYIAAISGINEELYEAARIDGAGKLRQLTSITLPSIMGTIVIMFIMRVGRILSVGFETIILLYNPSIYSTADVISTFVYRTGLQEGNYSYASAVDLFNSIVALILVMAANKLSRKFADSGLW